MIKEYELSLEDYLFLADIRASKESIFPNKFNNLMLGWIELGQKYGFNPYSVKQINGSYYKFTAESIENEIA